MKKTLIVIDMQNDFVTGALGSKEAVAILPNVKKKIEEYIAGGHEVIFTRDTHGENYMETREGKYLPVPHCIRGTEGHGLYGEVARMQQSDDAVFCKETFGSRALFAHLLEKGYTDIELCGVVTNICVISNAVLAKTALPEADVRVNAALCASNDPDLHRKALDVMASFQIEII